MEEAAIVFHIGPFAISSVVVISWGIMLALSVFCWLATRRLALDPGPLQTMLEGVVSAMEESICAVLPDRAQQVLPFIGTLWIYILFSNLIGLIPELHSPTGNLSVTAGLALLVFLSVHWFGVRNEGLRHYLKNYLSPSPIMLPFHLLGEVTRTAWRCGCSATSWSLEMAALLVLLVAGQRAGAAVDAAYRRGFSAGLYIRYAGTDLCGGRHAIATES